MTETESVSTSEIDTPAESAKSSFVMRKKGRGKSRSRKTGTGLESLTRQQRRVYDYIRDSIRSANKSPTLKDIAEAMGFRSINGVMCHLRALEQKGVINREEGQARGILISIDEPIRANRFGDVVILDCGDRVYELDTASASRLGQALMTQSGVPLENTR